MSAPTHPRPLPPISPCTGCGLQALGKRGAGEGGDGRTRRLVGKGLVVSMWSPSRGVPRTLALDSSGVLHQSSHPQPSLPLPFHSTHSKLVIEPVSEQGVRQLSEVGLTQGGDTVNVLKVNISPQVWLPFSLKFLPGEVQSSLEWRGSGATCGQREL